MSDLIKREDAIKALAEVLYDEPPYLNSIEKCETFARKTLEDIPSTEPKQGEWIRCKSERMILGYECSQCGEVCRKIEYNPDCDFHSPSWNYCPSCGARMRKGADGE